MSEQPLDIDEEDLPLASEITTADFHVLLSKCNSLIGKKRNS
jgi:hypothetical protein